MTFPLFKFHEFYKPSRTSKTYLVLLFSDSSKISHFDVVTAKKKDKNHGDFKILKTLWCIYQEEINLQTML